MSEAIAERFAAPEAVHIRERVVVAPCSGRFAPLPPETITSEGEWVEPGQRLAEIRREGRAEEVVSSWRGWLMGMLALEGQPVRPGDALFWVWSC
jgi:biotin carboxyl carrier protein